METKETNAIKRRDLFRSALSVSSLLLVPGGVAIAAEDSQAGELNLEKPADLLRAHVKMRCSLGPDMSIGWLRGKRFSVSEGRVAHDEASVAEQRASDESLDHDDPIEELFRCFIVSQIQNLFAVIPGYSACSI